MTQLHTLASGSSGNSLLISCGETHILLDAGISYRRICASLKSLMLCSDDLSAVLVTHIHGDHIGGLATMVKHCAAPIYAGEETARALRYRIAGIDPLLRPFPVGETLSIGSCRVKTFPTSHDAPGSTGYRIDSADGSVGVLTDSGFVTDAAAAALPGVALLVLEANHDVALLRGGNYPYPLKKRILSELGHLSNEAAADFAVTAANAGTHEIVLAHLSRENNTPALALAAVEGKLHAAGLFPRLSVAPRDCCSVGYAPEARCSR